MHSMNSTPPLSSHISHHFFLIKRHVRTCSQNTTATLADWFLIPHMAYFNECRYRQGHLYAYKLQCWPISCKLAHGSDTTGSGSVTELFEPNFFHVFQCPEPFAPSGEYSENHCASIWLTALPCSIQYTTRGRIRPLPSAPPGSSSVRPVPESDAS